MEEKLEQLIRESSFDELSPPERAYVLSLMTEADYNACHDALPRIIAGFASSSAPLSPSPETFRQLKNSFRTGSQKPSGWHALRDAINFTFPRHRFLSPVYGLIFVAAAALIIWLPIKLSHRIQQEPVAQKTQHFEQTYAPRDNDLALNDAASAPERKTSKMWVQKNKSAYSQPLHSGLIKDVGMAEKYPCYDITIPIDHAENNQDINWKANAPGLHANLLIPDINPIHAGADTHNSPD